MGFDPANYPENWGEIRVAVLERAKNSDGIAQCECLGECGLHQTRAAAGSGLYLQPGLRRCQELNGHPAKWAKGKIVLTTAHLCHEPKCSNLDHLIGACQRCHLRIDINLHRVHRRQRRERETGQQRLVPD